MNKAEKIGLQVPIGFGHESGNVGAVINSTSFPSDGKKHTFAFPLLGILNMMKMYPKIW
jgi:hypothetical protein